MVAFLARQALAEPLQGLSQEGAMRIGRRSKKTSDESEPISSQSPKLVVFAALRATGLERRRTRSRSLPLVWQKKLLQ
jgi:hypothetical protein